MGERGRAAEGRREAVLLVDILPTRPGRLRKRDLTVFLRDVLLRKALDPVPGLVDIILGFPFRLDLFAPVAVWSLRWGCGVCKG